MKTLMNLSALIIIISFFTSALYAQNKKSTDSISILILKDSSVYAEELMLQLQTIENISSAKIVK